MGNSIGGKKAFNNGKVEIFLGSNDIVPDGFSEGGLCYRSKEEYLESAKKGSKTLKEHIAGDPNYKTHNAKMSRAEKDEFIATHKDDYILNYLEYGEVWCHDFYGLSYGFIREVNKAYNIHEMALEKGNEKRKQSWKDRKAESDTALCARVPRDDLIRYYEEENHCWEEVLRHFSITNSELVKLLKLYEFHKSPSKHSELVYKSKSDNGNIDASRYEDEILAILPSDLTVIKSDRSILDGKEIDIFIPSLNLGIEFNGTYWHSSYIKDSNYHSDKSKLALQKGINLIHIYEYEWTNEEFKPYIVNYLKKMVRGESKFLSDGEVIAHIEEELNTISVEIINGDDTINYFHFTRVSDELCSLDYFGSNEYLKMALDSLLNFYNKSYMYIMSSLDKPCLGLEKFTHLDHFIEPEPIYVFGNKEVGKLDTEKYDKLYEIYGAGKAVYKYKIDI